MALEGDFGALDRTIDAIGGLRSIMPKVTAAAKAETAAQYKLQWTRQSDPWGTKWDPTQDGDAPALRDSGAMQGASVLAAGNQIRIDPPPYWRFHQGGANGMATRKVLPFGPSNWDGPIEKKIDAVVMKQLAKAP